MPDDNMDFSSWHVIHYTPNQFAPMREVVIYCGDDATHRFYTETLEKVTCTACLLESGHILEALEKEEI